MRIQWLLASRYLKGRMQRSVLTTLAIILGVAILIRVGRWYQGRLSQASRIHAGPHLFPHG